MARRGTSLELALERNQRDGGDSTYSVYDSSSSEGACADPGAGVSVPQGPGRPRLAAAMVCFVAASVCASLVQSAALSSQKGGAPRYSYPFVYAALARGWRGVALVLHAAGAAMLNRPAAVTRILVSTSAPRLRAPGTSAGARTFDAAVIIALAALLGIAISTENWVYSAMSLTMINIIGALYPVVLIAVGALFTCWRYLPSPRAWHLTCGTGFTRLGAAPDEASDGAPVGILDWVSAPAPWDSAAAAAALRARNAGSGSGSGSSASASAEMLARSPLPRWATLCMRYSAVGLMIVGSIVAVYGPGGVRASIAAIYLAVLGAYALHTYARRAMLASRGWAFIAFLRASIGPEFGALCAIAWLYTPAGGWGAASLARGLGYTALSALPDTAAWVLGIWLQRHTSPLSVSVLGNVAGLLLVCADIVLLSGGAPLRAATVAGFAITAAGLVLYTYAESDTP